jgi:hypothetical protein
LISLIDLNDIFFPSKRATPERGRTAQVIGQVATRCDLADEACGSNSDSNSIPLDRRTACAEADDLRAALQTVGRSVIKP